MIRAQRCLSLTYNVLKRTTYGIKFCYPHRPGDNTSIVLRNFVFKYFASAKVSFTQTMQVKSVIQIFFAKPS